MSTIRAYRYVRPLLFSFWDSVPALYYGLFLLLGAILAFSPSYALLFVFSLLLFTERERLIFGMLAGVLFWLLCTSAVVFPPSWGKDVEGVATFEVVDWVHEVRYGRTYCKMKVDLHHFEAEDKSFFANNIPCKLIWNEPATRPKADFIWRTKAFLQEHEGNWTVKLIKDAPLQKVAPSYSLAEWRHKARGYAKRLFARYLEPGETRELLEGVLLGEFHDKELKKALGRFGLQHITVVSGFHFSLIAIILAAFFRLLLPWRGTIIALLLAATFYLLFIGPSPSVLRAYIAVVIMYGSKLVERQSSGLNCLGIGLILVLAYDPVSSTNIGFSLSFLATFAILLFYPIFESALKRCFPERTFQTVVKMPFLDQLLFVLLRFFIASFALVASVSLLTLPYSLYLFGQFPIMGMLYNAFFPFFVSIAVFIVALGLLFIWLPPVAYAFFHIASTLLDASLTLVTHAPSWCDYSIRADCLSGPIVVAYLVLISLLGIAYSEK